MDPEMTARNRAYTIGELIDEQAAAKMPTRIIRDFLPDGTPYMVVVAMGDSAIALNEAFGIMQAPVAGPVVPLVQAKLNRAQRRKR